MKKAGNILRRLLHLPRNERGDEGVNKILIIALIAIPLIIVLIVFGGQIVDWFNEAVLGLGGTDPIDPPTPTNP